jgi:electron transfer flavoprotein alpha subunit
MHRILIIAEHAKGRLKAGTGAAAGFAAAVCQKSAGTYEILVLGSEVSGLAQAAAHLGAAAVLIADAPALQEPLADRYAKVIERVARERGTTLVVAGVSTFSKDILPRAAALLDAAMVSDVVGIEGDEKDLLFRRVMYAGNVIATVRLTGSVRACTVRSSSFVAPAAGTGVSPVIDVTADAGSLPSATVFISREERAAGRPDATEARIVVSGGRALKNAAEFEQLIGGLADTLGAAVGSSRALVDSGITPNSLQIGQTGKIVAPDLYLAVGISGAIQHTAGMKDAKVVAAINQDPDAPIFELADYGLVADIFQAVPELIAKLKGRPS